LATGADSSRRTVGPMHQMSDAEWRQFVMTGTRTGQVGVTRADGRPHVTPVWFVLDRDQVVFTTEESNMKAKALRRDPRVALCVDDQEPLYSYALIEGEATLSDDLDALRRWSTVIGGRYMGPDRAEEFGKRNGVPGELLIRVSIASVIAIRDVAA
jgi:PPOX class probable F420-dependent enzyme